MSDTVRVNFSEPMPLFPLSDTVLLPHAIQPLQIFEPRYCQMIEDCLEANSQFALASLECLAARESGEQLRPAVCVGQIIEHKAVSHDRHFILLQGVCRARIDQMCEPSNGRMYRAASIRPLERLTENPPPLNHVRRQLRHLLNGPRLSRMCGASRVLQWMQSEEVPTHVLLEMIGFTLVKDVDVRYRLLEEGCPEGRAGLITDELSRLDELVLRASVQDMDWPKGLSWN